MVTANARTQALLQVVERVAPSDAPVLIIGATGTGKELVARQVHERSRRRGPFVAVNCGAFNETLVEAELFGHDAGAFTGAQRAKPGWFEAAEGGTLFLDEIGELPLAQQVKLLRVLQERQVVRVGSRQAIDIDVRLVAATNVDLSQAAEAGEFRRDLWYRLNTVTLNLPPLRQRRDEILPLARHFAGVYAARLSRPVPQLSEEAEHALLAHEWPGNIRELENVIHQALLLGTGDVLHADDLRLQASAAPAHERSQAARHGDDQLLLQALKRLMEQQRPQLHEHVERLLVHAAYEHCERNQVHGARLLGISRNIFRAQLIRHGLLAARAPTLLAPF
jgi:sigma-54-specific transcriptional regulator